jgi:acetoin utilization deacetylase AcuC-like enzyme
MRLLYMTHEAFFRHRTGPHHPERPSRLEAVQRGIDTAPAHVVALEPPLVERELLERVHAPEYVSSMEVFCQAGGGSLDPDTYAGEESWEAALRAAGAGPAAVEALQGGGAEAAFLAVRPPGHHAERSRAMGFCLFNNIAVAAQMLVDEGSRVAIVDWDVHHGNGTQSMFSATPAVLYVSLHEYPFYPGTGWLDEVGEGPGRGTVVNVPLPAMTAGDVYRAAFRKLIRPVVVGFEPDWLLVSAGYDAHLADPLASLRLLASDYAAMARTLTGSVSPGRTVVFLEGGYDLLALEKSVSATVAGFAGIDVPDEPNRPASPEDSWSALRAAIEAARSFHQAAQD